MIWMYCQAHHHPEKELCNKCRQLADYAAKRLLKCPYGLAKPTCAKWPTEVGPNPLSFGSIIGGIFRQEEQLYEYLCRTRHAEAHDPACGEYKQSHNILKGKMMSELINSAEKRKELLKHMILQLHEGKEPEVVRQQLLELLGSVPYGEVVEVEQELISEGLPQEQVLQLCDVHSQALRGVVSEDESLHLAAGHPVDTFKRENRALQLEIAEIENILKQCETGNFAQLLPKLKLHFNNLSDVDVHYRRVENLVFPCLEKLGITGPPAVMWGKHDEIRDLLKAVHEALGVGAAELQDDLKPLIDFVIKPTTAAIEEMIYKEEKILLPMCVERLSEADWFEIYNASAEIGFCLYEPQAEWRPQDITVQQEQWASAGGVQLPSGGFTVEELMTVLNTLPIDITFVDKDDKVKYFSQGAARIFDRNRSILGRSVQMCHPPTSVHVVEQILNDFKSGKESRAPFWIQMNGKFIHIEYFAVRGQDGAYLGTLEVSQDLTALRGLEGEQRLLSYGQNRES